MYRAWSNKFAHGPPAGKKIVCEAAVGYLSDSSFIFASEKIPAEMQGESGRWPSLCTGSENVRAL